MIVKLMKIELLKILKKKSVYIIWGMMLLFCFFNCFLYFRDYDEEGRYLYEEKENIEEEIKSLEKEKENTTSGTDTEVLLKTKIELLQLKKTFPKNSWQYFKINDDLEDALYEKNKDSTNLEKKKYYDTLVLKLKNNDYSYFWDKEKKTLKEQIAELKEEIKQEKDSSSLEKSLKEKEEALEVLNYRIKNKIVEDNGYLNTALSTYLTSRERLKTMSKNTDQEKNAYQEVKKEMKMSEKILQDKVNYQKENTLNSLIKGMMNDYEIFFIVILLMVSASMMCDEFQKGTVKFLLIKPVSRFIILLSKYFTSLLVLFLSILLVLFFNLLIGGIFFGVDSLHLGVIVYDYGLDKVLHLNVFLWFLISLLAKLPSMLMLSLITLLLGIITSSTIISMIIPLMISIFSSSLLELAISHHLYWMRYLPNFTWQFSSYLFGKPAELKGLDLKFSCVFYSLYFILFFILTKRIFSKKDIKNV